MKERLNFIHLKQGELRPQLDSKMNISSNDSIFVKKEQEQHGQDIKQNIPENLGAEEEKKGGFFHNLNPRDSSSTHELLIKKQKANKKSNFTALGVMQSQVSQPSSITGTSFGNNTISTSLISSSPTPSTISSMSTNSFSYGGESPFNILPYLANLAMNNDYNKDNEETMLGSNDDQITTVINYLQTMNGEHSDAVQANFQGLLGSCLSQHQQKNVISSSFNEANKNQRKNNQIKTNIGTLENSSVQFRPTLSHRSSSGDDSMCTPLANLASDKFQKTAVPSNTINSRSRSSSAPSKSASLKSSKSNNAKITKRPETILPKGSTKIKGRARSISTSSTFTTDSTSTINGKRCKFEGCIKHSQGNTPFCIAHGGGRRCTVPGCTRGARDQLFCCAHGGGKRCIISGCTKSAVGPTNRCCVHGGGRRCKFIDPETDKPCDKSAQSSTDFCVRHGGGRKCQIHLCEKVARGRLRLCSYHNRDLNEALQDPQWQHDESPSGEKQAQIIERLNTKALLMDAGFNSLEKQNPGSQKIPTRRGTNATKQKNMNINTKTHDIVTSAPTMSISLPNNFNGLPIPNRSELLININKGNQIERDQSDKEKPVEEQTNGSSFDEFDPQFTTNYLTNFSNLDGLSQNLDLFTSSEFYSKRSLNVHDQDFEKINDLIMFNGQYGHHDSHTALEHPYAVQEESMKFDNLSEGGSKNPQDSTLLRLEYLSMESDEIDPQSNNMSSNLVFDDLSNMNVQYDGNLPSPNFFMNTNV